MNTLNKIYHHHHHIWNKASYKLQKHLKSGNKMFLDVP